VVSAVAAERSPIEAYLDELHARLATVAAGAVADYIPELANADPGRFGIALATVDGTVYEAGDTRVPFTLQSVSKPLTFALALDDLGEAAVRARIGVEPTGEAFNSITLDARGLPLNPMVNAGAITATSLIAARDGRTPFERILDTYSAYAGRPLAVDEAVARSESETGHRNRAIAQLLAASKALGGDPDEVVERYFRQCSVALDCRDTALVAATLANGGVHPLTGVRVASAETVQRVLVVMATCGMYDAAGEWLYTVGLPAKSGVSGTIMAVLPGSLGIAVHSPPLDEKGNSVRGLRACRRLAADFDLHLVRDGSQRIPLHAAYTLAERRSKQVRTEAEVAALETLGRRTLVLELQGPLSFPAVEIVLRRVLGAEQGTGVVVLDLQRVELIVDSSVRFLARLAATLAQRGATLVLAGTRDHDVAVRRVKRLAVAAGAHVRSFDGHDAALAWCEDGLLAEEGLLREPTPIALRDHELLAGLPEADVAQITGLLEVHRYPAGTEIVEPREPGDRIYLVTAGRLTVLREDTDGTRHTLATLAPGMLFGELAFLSRRPHSGIVRADTAVECHELPRSSVERLAEIAPDARTALVLNLARILAGRVDSMRSEIALRDL
jgi:glutaminase